MAPAPVGTAGTPVYSATSVLNPTTLTPGTGTGYAVGDVILCFTACRVLAPTVATPSGWTSLMNVTGSSLFRIALFAKIAASTSEAAPSVVWSGLTTGASGDPVAAMCQAFSGLDISNIATLADVVSTVVQGGNSTTVVQGGAAITTTINDDLVLAFGVRSDDVANTWVATSYTNVTGGAGSGASMFTDSGLDLAGQWAYLIDATAGAVGATFFTISGGTITSQPSAGVQIALKASTSSAPANIVAPAITSDGTPATGETVSCSNGSWSGSPSGYTKQWQHDLGAGFVNITGETGDDYDIVLADGGHPLRCQVTATNGSGSTTTSSNTITPTVTEPVNTVAPVVSGTPVVGQTLATTDGTWSNTPLTFAYQWLLDGADIVGADEDEYVPVTGDIGHTVSVEVTAANAGGAGLPAASNGLAIVAEIVGDDVQIWTAAGSGLGGSPGEVMADPTVVFDAVSRAEGDSGDVEYRVVYVLNTHPVRTLTGTVVWIAVQTTSPKSDLAIGVAVQSAGSDVASIPNESTPPTSVTFSAPSSQGAGVSIGDLNPGEARGLWLRRTVLAGAVELPTDLCTLAGNGTPA